MRHSPIVVLAATAALIASVLGFPAAAAATVVPARSADEFVGSVGVNVHLAWPGTPYTEELPALEQRLGELGLRHVRDQLTLGAPGQYASLNSLAAAGIGSTLIMGSPANGDSGLDQLLGIVRNQLSGVEALEGPNEYNGSGDGNWKANLVHYQERLYNGAKGSPALASLPVLGPSLVGKGWEELGDVSAYLDDGNIHVYPEGNQPQNRLETVIARAASNSGSKPIWATETGYTNALNWTPAGAGENKPISEAAAGVYYPRLLLEYFSHGMVRTFPYELVDVSPNPALDDREDHFGLLRNDLSEKPAFAALRNLLGLLADRGPAFAPGSLDYTLSGQLGQLHSLLLQKRDGSFYLALWRWRSIWNPDEKKELSSPSEPVQVTLAAPAGSYSVYEPSVSAAPVAGAATPTAAVTVQVGAGVTILELGPASSGSGQGQGTQTAETAVTPGSGAFPAVLAAAGSGTAPILGPPAPSCRVPRLLGRRLAAARTRVGAAGCRLGRVKLRASRAAKPGRVLAQRPSPGRTVSATARIAIVVSR